MPVFTVHAKGSDAAAETVMHLLCGMVDVDDATTDIDRGTGEVVAQWAAPHVTYEVLLALVEHFDEIASFDWRDSW